jgi:hypothetical protein
MAERWSTVRSAQELEKVVHQEGAVLVATEPRQHARERWIVTAEDLQGVAVVTWVDRFSSYGTLHVTPRSLM